MCGKLDDGCGNLLDCGDYKLWQYYDYGAPQDVWDCPNTHPHDFICADDTVGGSPPPYPTCIANPNNSQLGWCCNEMQLP